jgi:outer membrane protein OmpA-like peptidoglycan-associated protein/tetratricopeptide (TPR) repeat protein
MKSKVNLYLIQLPNRVFFQNRYNFKMIKLVLHNIVFILFLLLTPNKILAQFEKANGFYQDKRYAAAIPHYEKGLKEKDNLVAKSRLAYCYRMLNQTEKAESIYADVVNNGKARSETYLYYAESLMSNSKYKEAKKWFQKYIILEPADSIAIKRAEDCDKVPLIQPYFKGIKIEEFNYNSDADDNSPVLTKEGLVFTSDRASGKSLLKEKSGWTGRDFLKLWISKFDTEKGIFAAPESYSGKLNELNKNTGSSTFTDDEEQIFFSRNGDNISKKNELTMQIYAAQRAGNRWKNEEKLDFCNEEQNYMHPSISSDGTMLFYAANAGGQGGMDIFMARKTKKGWGKTKNLGSVINTSNHEAFPYIHKDGRLFFCSKGHAGFGGFDIFVSKFDTLNEIWSQPVNLGRPINCSLDDISFFINKNDSLGCFTSGRNGGDDDVFLFWFGEQKKLNDVFNNSTTVTEVILENTIPLQPIEASKITTIPDKNTTIESKSIFKEKEIPTEKTAKNLQTVAPSYEAVKALPQNLPDLDRYLQNGSAQINMTFLLNGIRYDTAISVEIAADSYPEIALLYNLLERHPNTMLEIRSHTETLGDDKKNLAISKKRAKQIKKILIKKGISKNRLIATGMGEAILCNDCKNEVECPTEKHLENRRIELILLKF